MGEFINRVYRVFFVTGFLILASCTNDDEACKANLPVHPNSMDITVERLEDELFSTESPEEVSEFLSQHPVVKDYFLVGSRFPNDSVLADHLFNRIKNPYTDTLYREAKETFSDLSSFKTELELAFGILKSYYPETKTPIVKTIVTGFGSSEMFVSDSIIVIGLDYFIGPEGSYRPPDYPNYILNRYQKAYMVPAIMLILSNNYIKDNPQNTTMLADMLYYGKKYYFTKQMIPCAHDSLLIWYSGQELRDVKENEEVIWANFILNELLYETNHIEKRKYMDERPKVFEIGDKCPGRIGSWVGWEIVKQYMERNPSTLPQLMNETDVNKIFSQSKYKPKKSGLFN